MDYKNHYAQQLHLQLKEHFDIGTILTMIEKPKDASRGEFAFPCFELAKVYRKSPAVIAAEIAETMDSQWFDKVEAVGGYVNVFLNKSLVTQETLQQIAMNKEHYGNNRIGEGQTITIDLSSPNIARTFSMGHIRSTVIGNALAHIAEKSDYKVVRINHLGDWGTQFGKLIVAYRKWGNEQEVKRSPIKELLKLYVQFHHEVEHDETLEQQGRNWFKKLEDGNEEAVSLWEWFRKESLQEFSRIYDLLGISFDSLHGEAFYNDKMDRVVQLLEQKCLLAESDGAHVVMLEEEQLPPCLIKKSDGATLYATRDLAAALYRQETYRFTKALYVVGNEQTLHFKQVFAVLHKLGFPWAEGMKHIPFGMILKDGKRMSTRKGKVVLLEEVIEEAITLAQNSIEQKNPNLPNKEEVARQVGVGAVVFHDLKNDRMNDIEFSLQEMLKFEGETGPYVQYTHARARSLLRKGNYVESNEEINIEDELAWPIITLLIQFSETIERALVKNDPSQIAKYSIDLAQVFNKYYGSVKIVEENKQRQSRLALVCAVTIVLKEGLRLLGMSAPEEM